MSGAPPLRAVTYARVSTTAQAEDGLSLEAQREALAAHCAARGYVLVEHVADEGVSGRLEARPAVQRLLSLADARLVEVLVLVHVDRMGRENRIIQGLLHQVRSRGVRVESLKHGSADTPANRFLWNVLGSQAEYEWELIRERTMAGRQRRAREGRIPGHFRLLGYDTVLRWQAAAGQGEPGTLRINAAEAELVRYLFRRYDEGASLHQLVREARERGWRGKSGAELALTTVRSLLANPAYVGRAVYGREHQERYEEEYRDAEGVLRKRKRYRCGPHPPEHWIEIPCPALIDAALWDRVQARLAASHAVTTGRPSLLWPLRACLTCATCTGAGGRPRRYHGRRHSHNPQRPGYSRRHYVCPGCGAYRYADDLERDCWAVLTAVFAAGRLGAACRAQAERDREAAGDLAAAARERRAQLRDLEARERRLLDAALSGVISAALLQERGAALQAERRTVAAELAQLEAAGAAREDPEAAYARGEAQAAEIRAWLAAAADDPARMQPLFQRFVQVRLERGKPPEIRVVPPR